MLDTQQNSCTDLLGPSFELVAQHGIGALTLRPLAAAAGTTVSVLTYRFGRKEHLLARLIDAAHQQERGFLAPWRARLERLEAMPGSAVAEIADALLDELAGEHARRSLFFSELVQASAWDTDIRAPLAAWLDSRLAFWRLLVSKQHPAPSIDLAAVLQSYSIDETAFGLTLNALPSYRWLRKLALRRLCAPDAAAAVRAGDQRMFRLFFDELAQLPDTVAIDREAVALSGRKAEIARHAAAMIVTQGAEAVTHRAVSKAADLGVSTLSHHFRRQEDLLKAGLEEIIRQMWGRIEQPASAPAARLTPIWRATFAIALAATRHEELVASAAAMRRRRGENADRVLARMGLNRTYDTLTAQSISMAYMGQMMLTDPSAEQDEEGELYRLIETLDGWIGTKD